MEIATFSLPSKPQLAGIVGGSEVVVYRADWSLTDGGEAFVGEGKARDKLDVADLQSEGEHAYKMRLPSIGLEPENIILQDSYPSGEGRRGPRTRRSQGARNSP